MTTAATARRAPTSSTPLPWPTTRSACSPSSCASTRPAAHPTPMCCATPRSSSKPFWTMRCVWAPRKSPPATTPACAGTPIWAGSNCSRGQTRPKTKATFCTGWTSGSCPERCSRWARCARPRGGAWPRTSACPTPGRRTRPASASSASGRFASSLTHTTHPPPPPPPHPTGPPPGPIEDARGLVLGQHSGLSFYPLGQRQGLGIGGLKEQGAQHGGGAHAPWFVARKELATNTLRVVQGHDHPWLLSRALEAQDARWICGAAPAPGRYAAKTRYRQQDAPCTMASAGQTGFRLHFSEEQWAVTPGQSAVLYDGNVCLGGGVIAG